MFVLFTHLILFWESLGNQNCVYTYNACTYSYCYCLMCIRLFCRSNVLLYINIELAGKASFNGKYVTYGFDQQIIIVFQARATFRSQKSVLNWLFLVLRFMFSWTILFHAVIWYLECISSCYLWTQSDTVQIGSIA